jgi:hypothetical protein
LMSEPRMCPLIRDVHSPRPRRATAVVARAIRMRDASVADHNRYRGDGLSLAEQRDELHGVHEWHTPHNSPSFA